MSANAPGLLGSSLAQQFPILDNIQSNGKWAETRLLLSTKVTSGHRRYRHSLQCTSSSSATVVISSESFFCVTDWLAGPC